MNKSFNIEASLLANIALLEKNLYNANNDQIFKTMQTDNEFEMYKLDLKL